MHNVDLKRTRVFLSYAREDIAEARRLCLDLRRIGVDVWFDETKLLPGQKWRREIKKAIREAHFFAILLSRHSVTKRGVVQREIREALEVMQELPDDAVFVLPIRLEDVSPTNDRLSDLQRVDLFSDWEEGVRRIGLTLYGRPQATAISPRYPPVTTVLGMIARFAADRSISVQYALPPAFDRTFVAIAEWPLVAVVESLIANAVYHGVPGPKGARVLEVATVIHDTVVSFAFSNPAYVRTDERHLTGLGISLARRVLTQAGGGLAVRLAVDGETPTQWIFTATLTMPRVEEESTFA